MDAQLDIVEINTYQAMLKENVEAQKALETLKANDGSIEASFEELWTEQNGQPQAMPEGKSIWEVTRKVLRRELCGDDGFREKVKEYNKHPASAPLLTGLIVYVAGLLGASINPAIATVIVLYVVKVGVEIFCEYTEPAEVDTPAQKP